MTWDLQRLTTGAPTEDGRLTRTVTYELNKSWDDNSATWGTVVAPNTDLVPLLIQGKRPGAA